MNAYGPPLVYIPGAAVEASVGGGFVGVAVRIERGGSADVELWRRHPPTLNVLGLGRYAEARPRARIVRRLLLSLNVGTGPLAVADAVVGRTRWTRRFHSTVSDYCYWRGVRRAVDRPELWRRLASGTTILMYHSISAEARPGGRYVVSAARFARQMAWLRRRRYPILSMSELLRYRSEHRLPPPGSVVITADDGYADNYQIAYPVLRRYRLPATIFLVSEKVGAVNDWATDAELAGRPLMDWSAVHEMSSDGISFGSHSRTHPMLTAIPEEQASDELEGSRADLERELGRAVDILAYPYGSNNCTTRSLSARAGYAAACGIKGGLNGPSTDSYALRRTTVYGSDTLAHFALILKLGGRPQWLYPKRRG